MWRRVRLTAEFAVLFLGLPLLFAGRLLPLPLLPALWILAAACLVALRRSPDFERRRLWSVRPISGRVGPTLIPLAVVLPGLLLATVWLDPDRLWGFVRTRPLVWALVMLFYPVLSVYPQGIVYRVFVTHRYRELFPGPWARIVASGLAFALAHVILQNWIAPVTTLLGGLLFAWTYERTGSAFWAAVQHALCGCWVFTTGLGWHFYYGVLTP